MALKLAYPTQVYWKRWSVNVSWSLREDVIAS